MTVVTTADTSQLYALAARHGLKLHGPLTVNELGLDYRIVIATVDDGRRWVLRIPRRAEVSAKVEPEARVLAMLKNRLPFAVPDWRVANAELVAYPMLEDSTAMVIQPGSSTPDWVVPQDSEVFAESFATALAALHAVPISAAVDAGMLIRTPTQARQKVADDVDRVRREFVVNDKRLHRWQRWLDDDSSWPDFSVVVHGDLYVGHVLIDNTERVSGMIDWSEARVDDPAIDMAAHLMVFGEEGLAKLLLTYEAAGGRVWPRLAHHIAERLRSGRSPTHSSPSTRVTKSTSLRRRRSSQRNERTSIARSTTLFAATFLFRIGNAVAALALPWFVLSHTKERPGRAPRPLAASSRPSSARGLVVASSIGSGARPSH